VRCDFGNLTVISVYCPSGSSGPERQEAKFRFMDLFLPHLQRCTPKAAKWSSAATGTSPTKKST
jgi:exonuclease III